MLVIGRLGAPRMPWRASLAGGGGVGGWSLHERLVGAASAAGSVRTAPWARERLAAPWGAEVALPPACHLCARARGEAGARTGGRRVGGARGLLACVLHIY